MNLYGIRIVIYFCEVFQCYTFPLCQYLDEEIFSGSLLFSGVALLNWFTKALNSKNVLTVMSYHDHVLDLAPV